MGIYTDLSEADPIGPGAKTGLDRSSASQLKNKAVTIDPSIGAAYAASNEVASIPEQTDAGVADTYTLTLAFYGRLAEEVAVTTAAIAFDAVDTVIESAIDTAMASFPGWTDADVSVAMVGVAGLDDGIVTLTFDGTSVLGAPIVVTLAATGFTATTPITRTEGSGDRKALQALYELNAIEGTVHEAPSAPSDWVRGSRTGSGPRLQLILDLAYAASAEDGTDEVNIAIAALYPSV